MNKALQAPRAPHAPLRLAPTSVHLRTRLSKTIVVLFVLIQVSVSAGLGIALFQNWRLRLESTQLRLTRNANMGNFLVESALTSAAKSLDNTQALFQQALQKRPLSKPLASQLLSTSYASFQRYNKTDIFGLLLYADRNGMVYAQSSGSTEKPVNISDRRHFSQLRDQPHKQRAVGPLVLARTTGQWVFHLAVPLLDARGEFDGVLVQQIFANDIAAKLSSFIDIGQFDQMFTQYDGLDPSFVFPPPGYSHTLDSPLYLAVSRGKTRDTPSNGIFTLDTDTGPAGPPNKMLVGAATSQAYALTTYASFPLARLEHDFWLGNAYLILYWITGVCFVTGVFLYGYKLSRRLAQAQSESLHDALTTLHNRRALDETLPYLLRQSKRSQLPISVLFVDIDHFRHFNKNYGHESGDIALTTVARTLRDCARRPLDFVCRWGGEEFVLVLPQTDGDAAKTMAERILRGVRAIELQIASGVCSKLTVSVGYVTMVMAVDGTEEDLIGDADKAMLQAKSRGRDRCAQYVPAYAQASGGDPLHRATADHRADNGAPH